MSSYFETAKRLFFKQTFVFNRVDISLFNFHPQLRIVLAINGIFFNKKKSLLRFVCPFFGISLAIAGLALEYFTIIHCVTIENYSLATESFCYAVLLGGILTVSFGVVANADTQCLLVEKMNENFKYICKLENRYRHPFLKGQLLIWQLCVAWFSFVALVSGLYMLMPLGSLTYQTLFTTHDEHTARPLQFPLWLPHDDPYKTPNYEMFLVFESLCVIAFVQSFGVYIYVLFHILLHYYIIMDIIILQIEVLFDGVEENVALLSRNHSRRMEAQRIFNKRIGNIVNMHKSVLEAVKTVSRVYGVPLLYQVMCSSIVLCLSAYQFEEKLSNGKFDILFILLATATILQLWISCYLGSLIKIKAFEVGDACWNCGWHQTSLGQLVCSDLIIIILRAQQPVTIKFVGLPSVQLDTFSLLMSRAYSYFNLLRQYR